MVRKRKNHRKRPYVTGIAELDAAIHDLSERYCEPENRDLLNQILITSMKLALESHNRADLKLVNISFKQLRYALKVFSAYRNVRKVALFGSARTPEDAPEYTTAVHLAKRLADHGYYIITGAGGGIMEAGNKGAGIENSIGVNITLPFEQPPNKYMTDKSRLINFKHFFVRKLFFIKESDATVLFPGGFGTLDEGLENFTLFQTGKSAPRPIVLMQPNGTSYWDEWLIFVKRALLENGYISPSDMYLFYKADTVDDAVKYIMTYYKNYHSIRYVGGKTIFRLNCELPKKYLDDLSKEFSDILDGSTIEPCGLVPEEAAKGEYLDLPRIIMKFDKREYGRLNQLIHRINEYE